MEKAVIGKNIAFEKGVSDSMRELAGIEVFVYPETIGESCDVKTVGVIPVNAKVPVEDDPNSDLMTCMLVEFIEMDEDRKEHLGLI